MNIPFLDNWRKKHGPARGTAVLSAGPQDAAGIAGLLAECDLLRAQAEGHGVELDDTAASLEALDQLLPRWRDDPEVTPWLGNDAGLYLGTVVVRTVPGARWVLWPNGHPTVELRSGREIDVVETGHAWAETGTPELSQVYAEVSEP
ncbi:DUF6278 family protein [Streptomyces polyrhachis]|uniref:DUF6278 family protein n=1 Tax=Streptomyces polyrhachis TaxID=1282885 RepID=A0ABW2GJF2_9ACTN